MTTSEKIFNLCVESAKNSKNGYTFDLKEVWQQARKKYKLTKQVVIDALAIIAKEHEIKEGDVNGTFVLVELMEKSVEETPKADEVELSPMMKQFRELKDKHPDAIILFRCGDFYETYEDDAAECAKILGITLTKNRANARMAGFPYHALDTYLPKLIRAGKRVAICDQLEAPKVVKKASEHEAVETKDEKKVRRGYGRELTPCEIINLDAQKKARELYPEQFKRFGFFRFDTTNQKVYKNADEAIRAKADMNNLAYGIEVVEGVRYTGTSRINAYENFLTANT